MSDSSFKFVFEGPAFDDHDIDVNDLAPVLLALGKVVQEANRAVNGERADARLKVKATQAGSFEALLSIDVSWISAIGSMLDLVGQEDRIATANDLLDLLLKSGTVAGGVYGFFAALKKLRGRRPSDTRPGPDGTTIIVTGSDNFLVDNRTVVLLQDTATREAAEAFGERAARVPGLSALRFDPPGRENDLSLSKTDLPALQIPPPGEEDIVQSTLEREAWLKIVTSQFRDNYVWRFTDGGEKPFTARMDDPDFANAVAEGRIALSANDTLRCLLVETQTLSPTGLTKEISVARVLEHIPGAKQLRML